MNDFSMGIISGIAVSFLTWFTKMQLPLIRNFFDSESQRQAKQIAGEWDFRETFSDNTEDTFLMTLHCKGGIVTGEHVCLEGFDAKKRYRIDGSYKDHILTFRWNRHDNDSLESGTITARLTKDNVLEGHGLYVEPEDGKIYTSIITGKRGTS